MRKMLRPWIVMLVVVGLAGSPAFAGETSSPPLNPLNQVPTQIEEEHYSSESGELILVDALVLRPLGFAAFAVGLVGSLFTLPFAATSNSGDVVGKELIVEPFQYTFTRPLGDVDR